MSNPQAYRVIDWTEFASGIKEGDLLRTVGKVSNGFVIKPELTLDDFKGYYTPVIEIFLDDRGVEMATGETFLASRSESVYKIVSS